MRHSGGNGSNEQHCFARKGDASALNSDKEQDCPIAIGGEKLRELYSIHRKPLSVD
jgi:hypothetical protein